MKIETDLSTIEAFTLANTDVLVEQGYQRDKFEPLVRRGVEIAYAAVNRLADEVNASFPDHAKKSVVSGIVIGYLEKFVRDHAGLSDVVFLIALELIRREG